MKMPRVLRNKKLYLGFGLLFVLFGAFVLTKSYSVSGKVKDISTLEPAAGIKVAISGHEVTTDSDGNYKITGIKIFQNKTVHMSAKDEEFKSIDYQPKFEGSNAKLDVTLQPSLNLIVKRLTQGQINHQYDYLWLYMHPQSKIYWMSKESYTSLLKKRDDYYARYNQSTKSESIGSNVRHLDTWHDPVTKQDYKDVVEVPISEVDIIDGKEQPKTWLDYYQNVDGFFHYFTNVDKQRLQATLNSLDSLLN